MVGKCLAPSRLQNTHPSCVVDFLVARTHLAAEDLVVDEERLVWFKPSNAGMRTLQITRCEVGVACSSCHAPCAFWAQAQTVQAWANAGKPLLCAECAEDQHTGRCELIHDGKPFVLITESLKEGLNINHDVSEARRSLAHHTHPCCVCDAFCVVWMVDSVEKLILVLDWAEELIATKAIDYVMPPRSAAIEGAEEKFASFEANQDRWINGAARHAGTSIDRLPSLEEIRAGARLRAQALAACQAAAGQQQQVQQQQHQEQKRDASAAAEGSEAAGLSAWPIWR
eukprot:scaffold20.g7711.t1